MLFLNVSVRTGPANAAVGDAAERFLGPRHAHPIRIAQAAGGCVGSGGPAGRPSCGPETRGGFSGGNAGLFAVDGFCS